MTQKWYKEEYLESKHWRLVKSKVKKRDGFSCSFLRCDRDEQIDFHHLSYTRLNREGEEKDIVILCHFHHQQCHEDFLGRSIPLTRTELTRRYRRLKKAWWLRFRASHVLYMKRDLLIVIILLSLVSILFFFREQLITELAVKNNEYIYALKRVRELSTVNSNLRKEILRKTSFTYIASMAAELGFTKSIYIMLK